MWVIHRILGLGIPSFETLTVVSVLVLVIVEYISDFGSFMA
jgi:hypothetical protein